MHICFIIILYLWFEGGGALVQKDDGLRESLIIS